VDIVSSDEVTKEQVGLLMAGVSPEEAGVRKNGRVEPSKEEPAAGDKRAPALETNPIPPSDDGAGLESEQNPDKSEI
jgi:hypothetical protein